MPVRGENRRRLARLFLRSPVVELSALKRALGTTSRTMVFRALREAG